MEKSRSLELIQGQIKLLASLYGQAEDSPSFEKWRRDTRVILEKVFSEESPRVKEFMRINFRSRFAIGTDDLRNRQNSVEGFNAGRSSAISFLQSVVDEIEQFWDDSTPAGVASVNPLETVLKLCGMFHKVAKQLRDRREGRTTISVEDEYDVQDLLHALLKIDFDDIRPEEPTPSYAGKAARMDFVLKDHQIVLEVKKTRKGLAGGEVGSELLVDIARYKSHPDCKTLVCFIYDPEARIGNPAGLENDLSGDRDGLKVVAIVNPK